MEMGKLKMCLFEYTTIKNDVRRDQLLTSYGDLNCRIYYYLYITLILDLAVFSDL